MLKVSDERSVCMCLTESSRIECKGIVQKLRQIDGVILVRIYKQQKDSELTNQRVARVCLLGGGPNTPQRGTTVKFGPGIQLLRGSKYYEGPNTT